MRIKVNWLAIAAAAAAVNSFHSSKLTTAFMIFRRIRSMSVTPSNKMKPCRLFNLMVQSRITSRYDRPPSRKGCFYQSFHPTYSQSLLHSHETERDRIEALHSELNKLGVDADDLGCAVSKSLSTTDGYDEKYGKSAIRAYRSFIYPRNVQSDNTMMGSVRRPSREDIKVAANRFARQIDFLAKHHRSQVTEWVRHTDTNGTVGL